MHENKISKATFVKELLDEVEEMNTSGTTYRRETALLSLNIAKSVSDFEIFSDMKSTLQCVKKYLPQTTTQERVLDVSKMLNTVLKSLERKAMMSETMKKKLYERSQNRKPFSMTLIK